ncbi:hypothetical protein FCS83_07425 [Oenococcus sp. UCMA 17063]|nr:hypothetical protein [Oenococcus sp. UCMA 17063]
MRHLPVLMRRKIGHGILKAPKIIGWDAVGLVESIGDKVSLFKKGDLVFYAGSFKRLSLILMPTLLRAVTVSELSFKLGMVKFSGRDRKNKT